MRAVYIVFNEDNGKVVLKTVNRKLAFRFMLFDKSGRNLKMYIRKEAVNG